MTEVLAPACFTASATVSKIGTVPSMAAWPPLPGRVPATTFVP